MGCWGVVVAGQRRNQSRHHCGPPPRPVCGLCPARWHLKGVIKSFLWGRLWSEPQVPQKGILGQAWRQCIWKVRGRLGVPPTSSLFCSLEGWLWEVNPEMSRCPSGFSPLSVGLSQGGGPRVFPKHTNCLKPLFHTDTNPPPLSPIRSTQPLASKAFQPHKK